MKFKIERTYLVRTEDELDIDPKNFLHCANIMEITDELEEYISSKGEHPRHPKLVYSEELSCRYYDNWPFEDGAKSFYLEWQKLKGLPEEF